MPVGALAVGGGAVDVHVHGVGGGADDGLGRWNSTAHVLVEFVGRILRTTPPCGYPFTSEGEVVGGDAVADRVVGVGVLLAEDGGVGDGNVVAPVAVCGGDFGTVVVFYGLTQRHGGHRGRLLNRNPNFRTFAL